MREIKKAQLGESWALPGDLCIVERLPGLEESPALWRGFELVARTLYSLAACRRCLVQMAGAELRHSVFTHDIPRVPQRFRDLASFKGLTLCESAFAFICIEAPTMASLPGWRHQDA